MLSMGNIASRLKSSSLLKGFSIYFGTSVINKALPFFLLPVLTKYLTPAEYGILAIYQVMIAFSTPFIGMNMHSNITRNFFVKSHEYLAKIVFNLLLVLITTSSVFFILVSCYIYFGGNFFQIPDRWIYVLPLLAMMNMVNEFNLTIFRNQQRPIIYGVYEISRTLLNLSLTLLLVVVYLKGWEGRAGGLVLSVAVFGVIGLIRLKKDNFISCKLDKDIIKQILSISIPLIPHVLGGVIITLSDRVFIERMIGVNDVGIYSVGYQFGMVMSLVVASFSRSWSPWFYQKLANPTSEKKKKIVQATYGYAIVVIMLAIAITFMSYLLIPLMTTESFHGASAYVAWIAFGYAFHGLYMMFFPYSVLVGRTSFIGIITFFVACLNLIGNYFLIKLNGTVGAAQSTLLSYVCMMLCVWWYSNKLYPMPWLKLSHKS